MASLLHRTSMTGRMASARGLHHRYHRQQQGKRRDFGSGRENCGNHSQNFAEEENKSLITGLQISQIKDLIQTLSDETKEMVYLGITGADITAEISEKREFPWVFL